MPVARSGGGGAARSIRCAFRGSRPAQPEATPRVPRSHRASAGARRHSIEGPSRFAGLHAPPRTPASGRLGAPDRKRSEVRSSRRENARPLRSGRSHGAGCALIRRRCRYVQARNQPQRSPSAGARPSRSTPGGKRLGSRAPDRYSGALDPTHVACLPARREAWLPRRTLPPITLCTVRGFLAGGPLRSPRCELDRDLE